jgi:fluoroacetyl-CoA thioesterase
MKSSLQPGVALKKTVTVDRPRTIGFMGEEARVYATPSMILDIEQTCRELILQHADAGEDSVGIDVSVKHLAASLLGMAVEIDVKITAVEGRKVTFEVAVKDAFDAICAGTHARFIVDVQKTIERLRAKAAKAAAAGKV